MSDIVIRHTEPKDIDAVRQIHAQPGVYYNTLQVPHPPGHMWREWLIDTPGVEQLVACIDEQVVGHLSIAVVQRPRHSYAADFGVNVDSRWHNRGVTSALMCTMIDMHNNWLRVERIKLTAFTDNTSAIAVYKKYDFKIEDTGRRYALRNGEYVDTYYMARMKQRVAGWRRLVALCALPAS